METNEIEPLVVALHEAAFGRRAWDLVLRMLAQVAGVRSAGLIGVATRDRRIRDLYVAPTSPELDAAAHVWLAAVRDIDESCLPNGWFAITRPLRMEPLPASDTGSLPSEAPDRSSVWCRTVYRDSCLTVLWAIEQASGDPTSAVDRRTMLDRVAFHLESAVRVCRFLETSCAERLAGRALLSHWPEAVVLVDESCSVLYMNAAAQSFLAQEDSVFETGGRLGCRHPHDDRAFADAVRRVIVGASDGAAHPVAVHHRLRGAPIDVALYLFALPPEAMARTLPGRTFAAVVLHKHRGRPRMEPLMLERAFGLTPAETKVGLMLAAGESVHDIARQQGVSVTTVRSHLKSLFVKTGIHRQAELVRVLVTIGEIELPHPQASRVAA